MENVYSFVERENYKTGIVFLDVLILNSRERERWIESKNVVNKTLSSNVT